MIERSEGFLSEEHIDHEGEVFDYIKELHKYCWSFVRCMLPGAFGNLGDYMDEAKEKAESINLLNIVNLIKEALWCEGEHHKQWYLWEISEALKIKIEAFNNVQEPDKGIAP